ncbi:MAG: hypothetical protein AAB427_07550 [Chloroflexota bacterium]
MKPMIERNTLIAAAVTFVIGLLIGWMLLGWVIAPVQYVDAGPANLSDAFKIEYVQLVADSFALTNDAATAQKRLGYLGDGAGAAVDLALQNSSGIDSLRVSSLAALVPAGGAPAPGGGSGGGGTVGLLKTILPICAVGVLLIVVIGGALFFWRLRSKAPAPVKSRGQHPRSEGAVGSAARTGAAGEPTEAEVSYPPGEEPVSTFKTTYMLGNDLYDESFSVDDLQGDFLGECGVGISETIGVGDPKKVTAFEVWLFDKNDIKTVTNVVMSDHAYRDEALKSRLAPKGELVQARSGEIVRLETASLKVEARIVDLQYGSGVLPPNSFFQQLTFEISAWKK